MDRTLSHARQATPVGQHPLDALRAQYDAEIGRLRGELRRNDLTGDEAFAILQGLRRMYRLRGVITPAVQQGLGL